VTVGHGFVSKKQKNPHLKPGTFAPGTSVKNIRATFGTNAQLKSKNFKYIPPELKKYVQTVSEDGASVRGPSIAAVANMATSYHAEIENVSAEGFEYRPAVITSADVFEDQSARRRR